MNSERFHRVMALFQAACELDRSEREAYLTAQCGNDDALRREVEQMIAVDERSDCGDTPISAGDGPRLLAAEMVSRPDAVAQLSDPSPINMPKRLGKYEVIEKLGEGGMGIVYLGLQDNPQRRVALKVLKPNAATAGTLRRFEHEALVLGWLNHDGIARIYEADAHESNGVSLPYIAMEYIAGKSLSRYLAESSPPPGIDERLRLFIRICNAVSYAHQQGIIHRDLKPSNVLVDETGAPKVLDFGVARLLDADLRAVTLNTSAGEVIGTLAYMSPEQVAGETHEIDTRTDVYALGVMLYEMLCGRHPQEFGMRSWIDAAQIIRDQPPTPLSAINARLRGDLETIVHKALAKDKERRYQSVSEFSNDIELFLANQPISARRDSGFYVLRKTMQRHRFAVGSAAAFVLLITAAAIALGVLYGKERTATRLASTARDEEAAARKQAEAVNHFLQSMLFRANPTESLAEPTVRDLLRDAESTIDVEFADQPRLQASMLLAISHARSGLGDFDEAERAAMAALTINREVLGDEHAEVASALHELSNIRLEQGRFDSADELCREALSMNRKVLGNDHDAVLEDMALLARIESECGQRDGAERLYRDVLDAYRQRDGDTGRRVATTMNDLAVCLSRAGKMKESGTLLRDAVAMHRKNLGERHLEVAVALGNLGNWHLAIEESTEAEACFREALSIYRERLGDDHPSTIAMMSNLSNALRSAGEIDEARSLIETVVAMQKERLGEKHPSVGISLNNLSAVQMMSGDVRGAVESARASLEVVRSAYGDKHSTTGKAMLNLARLLAKNGETEESDAMMGAGMKILRGSLTDDDPAMVAMLHNYAMRLLPKRQYEEAESAMRESLAIAMRILDKDHPMVARIHNGLGIVLLKKGDLDAAETEYQTAISVLEALPPPKNAISAEAIENLAEVKLRRKDFSEAEALLQRGLALRRESLPAGHPEIGFPLLQLGRVYLDRNDPDDPQRAASALRECYENRMGALPPTHWQVVEVTDLLGLALIRLKQFDEARTLLTTGYDRLIEKAESPIDLKQTLARRIVALYESSGESESAERWRKTLESLAPESTARDE